MPEQSEGSAARTLKPEKVEIDTDAGKVILLLVGGPHPYLWIGNDDGYLDSIGLDEVRSAARKVTRRESK